MGIDTLLASLQLIFLALALLALAWKIVTHLCTWLYFARSDKSGPANGFEPPVSIIKPVKGVDQTALYNFRSFCEQEYGSPYEILFCLDDPTDPALPLIHKTMAEYPAVDISLIFSGTVSTQAVGKLKKTIAGLAASAYDVIIFSDSDAYAPPSFLRDTVAAIEDCHTGLGFSAPAYEGPQNWEAALMAISVNELVLNMATPSLFGLFDGAVGTTMVVRKEVLEQIGGLERLGSQIVDDIPLARAVRKEGYAVHLLQQPATIRHERDTFAHWWAHWQRWQVIIRQYWPVKSFVMNVLDLALWWALFYLLIALIRGHNVMTGVLLLAATAITSLVSAAIINLNFARDPGLWRFWWTVPLRDLCRLPLLVQSYRTTEFVWRGERFRVSRGGSATVMESTEDSLIQPS